MRLPEWLVKAGAKLEGTKLFFGDLTDEVDYGMEDLPKGVIPVLYQVRSCKRDPETGEITHSSFECGLDLVVSKELVWINGAYFDTFAEAFRHFKDNERRHRDYDDFYVCEDHFNLCRYTDIYADDEMEQCIGQELSYTPPTIKLLE